MGLLTRALTYGVQAAALVTNNAAPAMVKAGKFAGPKIGSLLTGGFKAGSKAGAKATRSLVNGEFKQSAGFFMNGAAANAGKIAGYSAGEVNTIATAGKGFLEMAEGFELKGVNKMRGNMTGKNHTGKKYGGLLKKNDDSLFFGRKATLLGVGVAATVGTASGTVDAAKEFNQEHMGRNVGSARNAPINTYVNQPTMGNAYANNGGATGDLVLALNNQRHNGFL